MTNKDRREAAYLIQLAADLAVARTKLDPSWPAWRKAIFWEDLDPKIAAFRARTKALTGSSCAL